MPQTDRTRRSALYMPGSNPRALEKARGLACDVIIMDLEDSVTAERKQEARDQICTTLKQGGYGPREILVRINHPDTPWGKDDIAQMASCGADGLLMPKTESTDSIHQALDLMDRANAPADMKLWFMIETPMGVLKALDLAGASDRLGGIVLGTEDLAKELGCLKRWVHS